MATTGRKYPGTVDDIGNADTNPNNVKADDGSCAELVNHGSAHGLRCYNFQLGIPAGSTIDEIKFGLQAVADNLYFACSAQYGQVFAYASIILAGVCSGSQGTTCLDGCSCSDVVEWEQTLAAFCRDQFTVSDLNDNTDDIWYVDVYLLNSDGLAIGNKGFVDVVWVEVEYTPGAVGVDAPLKWTPHAAI